MKAKLPPFTGEKLEWGKRMYIRQPLHEKCNSFWFWIYILASHSLQTGKDWTEKLT